VEISPKALQPFIAKLLIAAGTIASSQSALAGEAKLKLLPGGIVFPEYNSAGLGNPGALAGEDARLARVLVEPNLFGATTQAVGLDYTFTQPNWGLDAGYDVGRSVITGVGGSDLSHTLHGAVGGRLDAFGFGVSYVHPLNNNDTVSATGMAGELDFGMSLNVGNSRIAMVIEGLNQTASATLGFGVQQKNAYAIEIDLALPTFSGGFTTPGATYMFVLAPSLDLGFFGVGYMTRYAYSFTGADSGGGSALDNPLGLSHHFALLLRITDTGSLSFRFDFTDYLIIGLTLKI
jgi:hypothetical protein